MRNRVVRVGQSHRLSSREKIDIEASPSHCVIEDASVQPRTRRGNE